MTTHPFILIDIILHLHPVHHEVVTVFLNIDFAFIFAKGLTLSSGSTYNIVYIIEKAQYEKFEDYMRFLRQFMIILLLSFLGEVLKMSIPLPIPASVYGLVLMLICLMTGILKTGQVRDAAFFLIEIMPVMFIPAAAGLIDSWVVLRP